MAPYIGTPTSRIDGIAKVTAAAKYAAEFNLLGVLYGNGAFAIPLCSQPAAISPLMLKMGIRHFCGGETAMLCLIWPQKH